MMSGHRYEWSKVRQNRQINGSGQFKEATYNLLVLYLNLTGMHDTNEWPRILSEDEIMMPPNRKIRTKQCGLEQLLLSAWKVAAHSLFLFSSDVFKIPVESLPRNGHRVHGRS